MNENKDNEEVSKALSIKVINNFINGDIKNINQFCSSADIKPQAFHKCLDSIKESNSLLHGRCIAKIYNIKPEKYAAGINETKRFVMLIKSGSIDLLDYFLTSRLSPHDFVNIAKTFCSAGEMKLIKLFFGNIIDDPTVINVSTVVNGKQVLLVNGHEYIVPKEAKEAVIYFLMEHHIPLYQSVYSVALKRYLKVDVLFNKEMIVTNQESDHIK